VGELVDRAVHDATRAMLDHDKQLAAMTILRDLPVNRATREIDQLCHRFVARHFPSAGVLRTVSAILRISTALERIGDYAVSIAKSATNVRRAPSSTVTGDVELMGEQARSMLFQALKAFEEESDELARGTSVMESQADIVYRKVFRDLLSEGDQSGADVSDLFALLNTFNRLERITDQAKNICEQTIFAVAGTMKPPKAVRVLFVDDRNAGASAMAESIARKAFPRCGQFDSEGWEPAEALDPAFVEFMDRQGHDVRDFRPTRFNPSFDVLRSYLVIIALAPDIRDHIPEIPWSAVILDWSSEVESIGPKGDFEDAHREALYKLLVTRITDLMDLLGGDRDCA
jgi:phosphate transport system protein